jgi:hypothetical protein
MAAGIDVSHALAEPTAAGVEACARRLPALGIDEAWVTPEPARSGDPERFDHLTPDGAVRSVPVLVPPTGRRGAFERARQIARETTLRVARVCPGGHRYPLLDWVLSPLPELCDRERMALLVDLAPDPVDWQELTEFARAFPSLPLLVLGTAPGGDRALPAALDRTANVVVEAGPGTDVDALVDLVDSFGPHRFAWGSGAGDAGFAARGRIEAALSDDDRDAVLGGTAAALADGSYGERHL